MAKAADVRRPGGAFGRVGRLINRLFSAKVVRVGLPAVVLAMAVWLINRELQQVRLADIFAALRAIRPGAIALAALFTAASFAGLAIVEWRILNLLGRPQPPLAAGARSFAANSLSSLVGFGLASGTALRVRIYRSAGLSPAEIARLVFLHSGATYAAGAVTLGLSALAAAGPISRAAGIPTFGVIALALLLLSPASLWFVLYRDGGPGWLDRTAMLAAGLADWMFSGAALFVLTSNHLAALAPFLAVFSLGSLLGGLAGLPGGLGVLDAAVLRLHLGSLGHVTAAALMLYRLIYMLGPAIVTLLGLAAYRLQAVAHARRTAEP